MFIIYNTKYTKNKIIITEIIVQLNKQTFKLNSKTNESIFFKQVR
jgi:hypothetical protein